MSYKQRLELDWIGKDIEPLLEPRILIESNERSFGDKNSENILIHGDNLLSLKALEAEYKNKVKCIYIDPPYNTGNAFAQYDDGLEHSLWLSLMSSRLKLLWNLLTPDGSIWISIDDSEMPYLRVLMDEICGRDKFVANMIWQKRYSRENREAIGDAHEYVIVYAKDLELFKKSRNKQAITDNQKNIYKNPNNDPRGPWRTVPMTAQGYRPNQMYKIVTPAGVEHYPPEGRCWSTVEDKYLKMVQEGRIYFGKDNRGQPNIIRYLSEVEGVVPWTWWPHEEVGHTDEAKKEQHALFDKNEAFATPKPERLIKRILEIATNEGDLVLDSFAGSGTTGAVAQKMNRKWIMIELGDHCYSHIIPRLKKVTSGEDQGGISKLLQWQGGGGFKFFELAPSLLQKDDKGNWVINDQYNALQLAEAVCKHEKFIFHPHESIFWKQGYSSEKDFIFITTQFLTSEHLDHIYSQMKKGETLLICAKAFRAHKDKYSRITLKKIPQMLLGRCEFGRDDYSLNVKEMVQEELDLNQ
jgi:adenine-specific DNA-methyltransferase